METCRCVEKVSIVRKHLVPLGPRKSDPQLIRYLQKYSSMNWICWKWNTWRESPGTIYLESLCTFFHRFWSCFMVNGSLKVFQSIVQLLLVNSNFLCPTLWSCSAVMVFTWFYHVLSFSRLPWLWKITGLKGLSHVNHGTKWAIFP